MKVVFSRKGFDSGTGGCPSPIFPDQRMTSLPIPGGAIARYSQLNSPVGPLGTLVRDLTSKAFTGHEPAHLDPDLWADSFERKPGWLPSLGQVGAAQSHLEAQGVGPGDLFLFFGWFRPVVQKEEGRWAFQPGSKDMHTLFGYMQIGEVVRLGAKPDTRALLEERPWLQGHPHVQGLRQENNTLYIASPRLVLNGHDTGLPGGGAFPKSIQELVLTAPGKSKSLWKVPDWLEGVPLSYHGDPSRWRRDDAGQLLLQTVAKGQEFVFDSSASPQAAPWITDLVAKGMGLDADPALRPARPRLRR